MRVSVDGSGNITGSDNQLGAGSVVEFPGNPSQYPGFPVGYTVTGTAPNRKLTAAAQTAGTGKIGSTSTEDVAAEIVTTTPVDQATQAELDAVSAAETAALAAHNTNAGAHGNLPYAPSVPQVLAPSSPASGAEWLSNSIADVRPPTGPADRYTVMQPSLGWEGGMTYEPRVWVDTQWNMIYTGNWPTPALGYATCPLASDPMVAANWTKQASPIIGQGGAGVAGNAVRPSVYIEGSTLYVYFVDNLVTGNIRVASGPDALHLTVQAGSCLAVTGAAKAMANSHVVKRGANDYVMLFESDSTGAGFWQMGYATATSPLGPFTVNTYPLTTLNQGAVSRPGGPWFIKEGSTWVLWFHSVPPDSTSHLPTRFYRATSTDLINWTVSTDPIFAPAATTEVDQVADPWLLTTASGVVYLFYDGVDNVAPTTAIMAAIVQPALKKWDGSRWSVQSAPNSASAVSTFLTKKLSGDFTSTTTGAATDITALSLVYTPNRNERCRVRLRAKVKTSVAGALEVSVNVSPTPYSGQNNPAAGADDFTTGYRTLELTEVFDLRANVAYTFQARFNNSQTGATTTVKSTAGHTGITLESSSVR